MPIHELKAAREVNRHWNQIAAQFFYPFCSKVVLSFNDDNYWTNARNYGIEEMGDFVNLVAMSEQCPFSVFDLGTSIMSPAGREKTVAEFLRVCGPYMQVLTVREDSCRKIFRKGVPQDLCFDSLRSLRIHLLQSLDEEVLENFFDLINAIVQVSPNLESFALISHHGFDGGEAVDCLIQTLLLCDLERLSSLQIEAQVNETNLVTLSTLGLTLKHLRMDFWGSHLPSPHGMKVFLNSQSPTLETFKFSDAAMSSLALIEFPCMQELQLLKIKGSMLGRISVSFPHISFIDQFPKLKTLSFSELFGEWEEFLKTGMKPSLTVEELRLPADFVDSACLTRAAYLFPNLKKLEVPYNPMLIGVVYDLMPHLEELAINTRYVSLIDDAITGISTEVCEEANQHRCYDLVLKELDQFQNSKSILSLKSKHCYFILNRSHEQ